MVANIFGYAFIPKKDICPTLVLSTFLDEPSNPLMFMTTKNISKKKV